MKIRNNLITLGAVAAAALTLSFSASGALLSPRAAGNQIIRTAGTNNDPNLVAFGLTSAEYTAPRLAANKIVTTAGVRTAINPSTLCTRNMTASPKVVQACAASPSAAMACCAAMAR
ncbi:MAG TPA: hypothetical protein VGY56_05075 [Verrucomicrobiae bacterium]|nr:hypothetical protein [Verrucomicrobiae bacterium]